MLQDPEKPFVEWTENIKAKNIDTARTKCEAIASRDPLIDVLTSRKRPKVLIEMVITNLFAGLKQR